MHFALKSTVHDGVTYEDMKSLLRH